jgi:hypothetical protein
MIRQRSLSLPHVACFQSRRVPAAIATLKVQVADQPWFGMENIPSKYHWRIVDVPVAVAADSGEGARAVTKGKNP